MSTTIQLDYLYSTITKNDKYGSKNERKMAEWVLPSRVDNGHCACSHIHTLGIPTTNAIIMIYISSLEKWQHDWSSTPALITYYRPCI